MKRRILNAILFQAGWFACVLGAAHDAPLLGPVFVLCWVGPWVIRNEARSAEALTVLGAAAIGYVCDALLVTGGVVELSGNHDVVAPTRPWMLALWISFAPTLRSSLSWLQGRWLLGALVGALGGPLAYSAAQSLGAVAIDPRPVSLLAIAAGWAIAMPLLLMTSRMAIRRYPPSEKHGR